MPGDLLTTGQAARLLGVSRQHVVDLCDAGRLEHLRVGTHRRVPMRAVARLVRTPEVLTREQERSLWLHRAVVAELLMNPQAVLSIARDNLDRWHGSQRADGRTAGAWSAWRQLIDGPLDELINTMLDRGVEASDLRQNSPFAGALPSRRRDAVLRSFVHHWSEEHSEATA